jgi:hypothetical protein
MCTSEIKAWNGKSLDKIKELIRINKKSCVPGTRPLSGKRVEDYLNPGLNPE